MSYISRVGNLAATPELRQNDRGQSYCFAKVIVNDYANVDGKYETTATTAYNLTVNGSQAEQLVSTAQRCGNIRVLFTGTYRVRDYTRKDGTLGQSHDVRVADIGAAFRGQQITANSNPGNDAWANQTETHQPEPTMDSRYGFPEDNQAPF